MSTTVIEKQTKQESLQYRYLSRMQEILIKDKRIDRECVYGSWVERLGGLLSRGVGGGKRRD